MAVVRGPGVRKGSGVEMTLSCHSGLRAAGELRTGAAEQRARQRSEIAVRKATEAARALSSAVAAISASPRLAFSRAWPWRGAGCPALSVL
eukprot:SM005829S18600  [mRNA]  locus=s5829:105:797:- [translate_table: standard]